MEKKIQSFRKEFNFKCQNWEPAGFNTQNFNEMN